MSAALSTDPATGARLPLAAVQAAELLLPPFADLDESLGFFVRRLGFRVAAIGPADAPRHASVEAYGLRLRLEVGAPPPAAAAAAVELRLLCGDVAAARAALALADGEGLVAPNGVRVSLVAADAPVVVPPPPPPPAPPLAVTRAPADGGWTVGRAGLLYRDLLPSRLGGRLISSHIRVAAEGPVDDYVHYHSVSFQAIFVRRGWVEVVYEDAGPAFVMRAGDCVLQPPRIRHRVLRASAGLEVVEVAVPAVHETTADAGMPLPNNGGVARPGREFGGGQRFVFHDAAAAEWRRLGASGEGVGEGAEAAAAASAAAGTAEASDLGIAAATRGLARMRVLRGGALHARAPSVDGVDFLFVVDGSATLRLGAGAGGAALALGAGDAAVIPPDADFELHVAGGDGRVLQLTMDRMG